MSCDTHSVGIVSLTLGHLIYLVRLLGLDHPWVLGDEMGDQKQPKLLRAGNAVLLSEHVDRVLLRVRRDDVAVVPPLVVLAGGQGQEGLNLKLLDGVDSPMLDKMEDLHTTLSILTLKNLEALPSCNIKSTCEL